MLNSAPDALIKQIIMEIFSWKLCIQCFESVKCYLITITLVFYFRFCMLNKSAPDALFSMTLKINTNTRNTYK
jgi:hypothetical protein